MLGITQGIQEGGPCFSRAFSNYEVEEVVRLLPVI